MILLRCPRHLTELLLQHLLMYSTSKIYLKSILFSPSPSSHHHHHLCSPQLPASSVPCFHSCHRMARLLILKHRLNHDTAVLLRIKLTWHTRTSMMWPVYFSLCTSVLFSLFQTQSQFVEYLHWVFPAFTSDSSSSLEWSSSHSSPNYYSSYKSFSHRSSH